MVRKTKKTAWKIFRVHPPLSLILPPFIALATETNPPMERELLQKPQRRRNTWKSYREQRRLLGDNALLETQIRMLEYHVMQNQKREVELFPSNIGIDLSGGLTHFWEPHSLDTESSKITEDSAGQMETNRSVYHLSLKMLLSWFASLLKSFEHTRGIIQNLLTNFTISRWRMGEYFFARQNRNIAEFRGELSYEYHSQENRALTSKLSWICFSLFFVFCKDVQNSFLESGYTPKRNLFSAYFDSRRQNDSKLHLLLDKRQHSHTPRRPRAKEKTQ